MKISKLIKKLQSTLTHSGDLDVVVDTEAAKFSCHLVDIKNVYVSPKIKKEIICYLQLDPTKKKTK
jgi:hypothetical protein